MIWLLISVLGLAVETGVIIALGRQVTSQYEAEVEAAGLQSPEQDCTVRRDQPARRAA